jgi:antitoxin component of MazEF toxin-antitoxin module
MDKHGDALTQALIGSITNPLGTSIQDMVKVEVGAKQLTLDKAKREFVQELEADLADAITAQADDDVLAGIRRLIKKYTS